MQFTSDSLQTHIFQYSNNKILIVINICFFGNCEQMETTWSIMSDSIKKQIINDENKFNLCNYN